MDFDIAAMFAAAVAWEVTYTGDDHRHLQTTTLAHHHMDTLGIVPDQNGVALRMGTPDDLSGVVQHLQCRIPTACNQYMRC